MEKFKLDQAAVREKERKEHELAIAADKLEAAACVAEEGMQLKDASEYANWSIAELQQALLDAKSHLKEFRMANFNLSKMLGDDFSLERSSQIQAQSNEVHKDWTGMIPFQVT